MNRTLCKKGFTLVELMITVAILAVLAVIAIPMYQNYINRAKQSDAIIGLKAAQMAEAQYYSENNIYCGTIEMLPGFSDGTVNNAYRYKKGKDYTYTLSASATTDPSAPAFVIAATWVDTGKGINDRWTISNDDIEPVADTSVPGIQGFSLFRWLFD